MKSVCSFLLILVLLFVGCDKKADENLIPEIKLPSTPLLVNNYKFGVCNSTYTRIRTNYSLNSMPLETLYKNQIVEVLTKNMDKDTINGIEDYWYLVSFDKIQGWVFGSYITLFENKEQAEEFIIK